MEGGVERGKGKKGRKKKKKEKKKNFKLVIRIGHSFFHILKRFDVFREKEKSVHVEIKSVIEGGNIKRGEE